MMIYINMSKIHKKTGSVCMICDEEIGNDGILFHKTRRQMVVLPAGNSGFLFSKTTHKPGFLLGF